VLTRGGSRPAAYAVACALLGGLLPALAVQAASPAEAARAASAGHVSVPAVVSADGLRAALPVGGRVTYALPALPVGGARMLGDWNGDGAQTAGIFDAGQWQLWNQLQRSAPPAVTVTFGQLGDVPVTGDWNGDGITDLGVVRGSEWILALGPVPAGGGTPPA
jgi:hypothetical protein